MKQKIKTWLIHKLGGVTKEEKDLVYCKNVEIGIYLFASCILGIMKREYGTDWMELVYNYIKNLKLSTRHILDTIGETRTSEELEEEFGKKMTDFCYGAPDA